MPTIELAGVDLFYGTGGVEWQDDRPLAVLVHGAGNDHTVWALQARTLAQHGFNVAAPDLPGHGRSHDRDDVSTIEDYTDVVAELVDRVVSDDAHDRGFALVGHSMGSCIASSLAARYALEARPLSLVLIGAGTSMPVNPGLLEATLERPLEAHRFITAFGYGRPSHFGGAESPGVWNLGAALALLERCSPEVLHRDFVACNEWRGEGILPDVAARTLVISGELDRMTPAAAGRALAESLRDAEYVRLPGVGHMMMAEAGSAVSDRLLGFLSEVR